MKRSIIENPNAQLGKLLFGSGANETKISQLAKATKIPQSTVYRDKEEPMKMTAERLLKYAKAKGIDTGELRV